MEKKKTTYQKLKDKNAELLKDIFTLVDNENFALVEEVRMKYKIILDMEAIMWFGTVKIK